MYLHDEPEDPYRVLYDAIRAHSNMDDDEIREAGEHGADAGWPGFTYTSDCVEFYTANRTAIWELAQQMADDFGYKNVPELVASFIRSEMADSPDGFENLLAWFALEKVGRWLEDNPQGGKKTKAPKAPRAPKTRRPNRCIK